MCLPLFVRATPFPRTCSGAWHAFQDQPDPGMRRGKCVCPSLHIINGVCPCFFSDITLVFRKRMSDRRRIARHLWRMGLAFFIAVGSAFTGPGASVFPEALRASGMLALPEAVTAVLILFWLVRTVFHRPRLEK